MHDEGRGFAELIDLSMLRNAGKISDAEYAEREAAVLERLSSIRDHGDELQDDEFVMDEGGDELVDLEPARDEVEC